MKEEREYKRLVLTLKVSATLFIIGFIASVVIIAETL